MKSWVRGDFFYPLWSRLRRLWSSGFVFLLCLCCVLFHVSLCFGDDDAMPITDLRLPLEYYEDGTIKSQLRAASAKVSAKGYIEASNIIVEFYSEQGNIELLIKADDCRWSREDRIATSESNVRLEREGVVITGTGFEWNVEEQCVKILDNVKVILKRGIKREEQ